MNQRSRNIVTRAKAQKQIAETEDPQILVDFLKHQNYHIRNQAGYKLDAISGQSSGMKGLTLFCKAIHRGEFDKLVQAGKEQQAEEKKAKRSEAAKKAAATRKAKKAA